jgi:hypothetical protein
MVRLGPPLHERPRAGAAEISDELVAMLGVCLAVLTAASGASIAEVRLGLRRLAEQLEPVGKVLDDGSHLQLAPL